MKINNLHKAAFYGHLESIADFINKGTHVDEVNNKGETALLIAAGKGHSDALNLLMRKGAKIDVRDNNDQTPLHYAAAMGHSAAISILLKKGAKINERDFEGETPLHAASIDNEKEAVLVLLENGAKIDEVDHYGHTALHLAVMYGRNELALTLIEKGANIHSKNKNGHTPLHMALIHGKNKIALELKSRVKNASNLFIRNPYILRPRKNLNQAIVDIARSMLGKMQWVSSNETFENSYKEHNDFIINYSRDVNIATQVWNASRIRFNSFDTADEPNNRLQMCCWEFGYFVLIKAKVIPENTVSDLLSLPKRGELTLTRALHGEHLDRYRSLEVIHPGDWIFYKRADDSEPHHAALYVGNGLVIQLLSGQVAYASLYQKKSDNDFGEPFRIPASELSINIQNFINSHITNCLRNLNR